MKFVTFTLNFYMSKIFKKFSLGIFFLIPCLSFASNIESNLHCFVSDSTQKIKLEMMEYSDPIRNWTGGYIKYRNSKNPITIVYQTRKILDETEGRPIYFENTWLEIVGAEITGKYVIGSQGANIYNFEYINLKSGKKYIFIETIERNSTDDGCKW
ncbi:hypothetical protein BH11PSE12_BH11PSE12_27590 [soil metagenome]